jgi:hypothetical protein
MIRNVRALLGAVVFFGATGCGGHPVQIGIYAPYPREQMMAEVQQKVAEMGYTVQRFDSLKYELIAERQLTPPVDGSDKEELIVSVVPDNTGSTKLTVTASRILPATADRPIKRVTASAKTNADANALIQMYMKARKRGTQPG